MYPDRLVQSLYILQSQQHQYGGTLKDELVYHQDYKTRFVAISDIIGYIELYYNQAGIQMGLGYQLPKQMWFDYYRQAA